MAKTICHNMLLLLTTLWLFHTDSIATTFKNGEEVTVNAGHVVLEWTTRDSRNADSTDPMTFVLESSTDAHFSEPKLVYEGLQTSTFLSGLPEGDRYFRVKHGNGPWSPTLVLHVAHYSSDVALLLFAIGFLSFAGICVVIWHGNRRYV